MFPCGPNSIVAGDRKPGRIVDSTDLKRFKDPFEARFVKTQILHEPLNVLLGKSNKQK